MKTSAFVAFIFLASLDLKAQFADSGQQPVAQKITTGILDPLFIVTAQNIQFHFSENIISLDTNQVEWIQKVTILREKEAFDQYGAQGKNGVVIIETDAEGLQKIPAEVKDKMRVE